MNPLLYASTLLLLAKQIQRKNNITREISGIPAVLPPSDRSSNEEPTPVNAAQIDDPIPEQVLCGFWFGWQPTLPFNDIPREYNMICVAFLEPDISGMPTFSPINMSDSEFRAGVEMLKSQGRVVLISLGGAHQGVSLTEADKQRFKDEILRIVNLYGFMGIDIDLEGTSVTAAQNRTVIPAALREIKDSFTAQGRPFFITLAPEFTELRGYDARYKPILIDLEGYYDLVFPQYYNQGADGIWSDEYNMYLSQNDNEHKAEFIYTLTHAIVTGTSDYMRIPADKFAIGLPASPAAALNGYVVNPADVLWALDRLASEGDAIRGLMTWSVNQDAANGFEFVNRYAPMIYR
ncbi:MAG: hypothetical protein LBB94_07305 [Clostridiales bacterium]|jgi:chitinase|nr:hypothetical protein [Clostridiales bacterium]